jgi:hypothetical protein
MSDSRKFFEKDELFVVASAVVVVLDEMSDSFSSLTVGERLTGTDPFVSLDKHSRRSRHLSLLLLLPLIADSFFCDVKASLRDDGGNDGDLLPLDDDTELGPR